MSEEEQEQFWRRIQSTVEKDVIRTDRSHSYFKGEDNPNIEVLQYVKYHISCLHSHVFSKAHCVLKYKKQSLTNQLLSDVYSKNCLNLKVACSPKGGPCLHSNFSYAPFMNTTVLLV